MFKSRKRKKRKPIARKIKKSKRDIYFNGSEKEKEIHFAHFTDFGYGIFSIVIMGIGLLLGVNIGGPLGWFIAVYIIGWVFWKFPNIIQSWDNIEKYNPDTKKYRIK